MITEAELLEHKWRKVDDKCWEKLGVRIEYPIILTTFPAIKIIYYHHSTRSTYSAISVPATISITALEAVIRTQVKYIFKLGPQKFPMTPKQKRTLKNWIL